MSNSPGPTHQQIGFVDTFILKDGLLDLPVNVSVHPNEAHPRLRRTDGTILYEVPVGSMDESSALLTALTRLVVREGVLAEGYVEPQQDRLHLLLRIHVANRLWQELPTSAWRRSPAAAIVFEHLQTPNSAGRQGQQNAATQLEAVAFSLASCFLELPSYAAEPVPASDAPEERSNTSSASMLHHLPSYVLQQALAHLSHKDLAAVSSTCLHLRQQALLTVPGLSLHLYPHQSRALQWMLKREQTCGKIQDPCWRGLVSQGGLPFWINTATGQFAADPPPDLYDCKGGLFCDEPGLGKTITGLSLISKSRGTVPSPGRAADGSEIKCTWVKDPKGRPAAYYTLPSQAAASLSKASGATRVSSRRSGSFAELQHSPSIPTSRQARSTASPGAKKGKLSATALDQGSPLQPQNPAQNMIMELSKTPSALNQAPSSKRTKPAPAGKKARFAESALEQGFVQQPQAQAQGCCSLSPDTVAPGQGTAKVPEQAAPEQGTSMQQASSLQLHTAAKPVLDLQTELKMQGAVQQAPVQADAGAVRDDAVKATGLQDANYTWVQCDLCDKWRELPKGCAVSEEAEWVCSMHPFSSMRSCTIPEDTVMVKAFQDCPGFIQRHEAYGSEKNIAHFQQTFQKYSSMASDRFSVAWWLTKQDPKAVCQGFTVPVTHRKAAGWEAFLKELGFTPCPPPTLSKGTPGGGGSSTGRKRKRSGGGAKAGAWQQPWWYASLLLDTAALLTALQAGPTAEEQKVYLSPATLLVLPPTLIPHWLHQIKTHLAPHTLRVAIITADNQRGLYAEENMPGVEYWSIGRGQGPLHELAFGYDLVLTTFSRLSADWSADSPNSPSKQIHWLRVILDEGHMLGASLSMTNKLQMACALKADRRWVMTGTPTPSTPSSHVAHLHPLLAFLHHQPYGIHKKTWEEAVQKPFEAGQGAGRIRLMALLRHIMIRAAKADLVTIPPCHHKVTYLEFAPEHASSYNELAEVIKLNLLLADWNDPDHNESLLSARNSKWGKEMLHNARMSCCVAGNCDLEVQESHVKETLELLGERLGHPQPQADWPPFVPPTHPLSYVEIALRHGGTCFHCDAVARLLVVTPCAHLFCLDCISLNKQACPSCRKPYLMQSVSEPARLETNPNPKWDVPMDVIEWQPAYTQKGALGLSGGAWSANWQITKSTKCVHLLRRLIDIGAAPDTSSPQDTGRRGRPLTKAIVFSQFWMHIQLINSHLRAHQVPIVVLKQDMTRKDKAAAVATFQHEDGVGVLVMDETGSVGLDLSFVGWVFLMEPLADASLQAQVTARAHRMGATQAIHVETLVMKGTAEESMLQLHDKQANAAPAQPPPASAQALTAMQSQDSELVPQEEAGTSSQAERSTGAGRATGRDRTEADRRSNRNSLLLSLHRVAVTELAQFEDLPLSPDSVQP